MQNPRERRPSDQPVIPWIERFVAPPNERGCRLWMRGTTNGGYGLVAVGQRNRQRVTRLLWAHYRGEIPEGMSVCHRCDTPRCCEITHLFLGTHSENMRDRNQKRRCPRGAAHPGAKLTEERVREIRALTAAGVKQKALAERYGVNQSTISYALNGRRQWGHVQ